jgi:hypothetical protein
MKTSEWRQAWEESNLQPWHRRVLCALSCSMGGNGGQAPTRCSPSFPRLGKRSGYKASRVKEVVAELEQLGWINVGRIRGLPNRYYATVPPAPSAPVVVFGECQGCGAWLGAEDGVCPDCGGTVLDLAARTGAE